MLKSLSHLAFDVEGVEDVGQLIQVIRQRLGSMSAIASASASGKRTTCIASMRSFSFVNMTLAVFARAVLRGNGNVSIPTCCYSLRLSAVQQCYRIWSAPHHKQK